MFLIGDRGENVIIFDFGLSCRMGNGGLSTSSVVNPFLALFDEFQQQASLSLSPYVGGAAGRTDWETSQSLNQHGNVIFVDTIMRFLFLFLFLL